MEKLFLFFDDLIILAVVTTIVFMTMSVVLRQEIRLSANDEQVQLAEYGASMIERGLAPEAATGPVRIDISRDHVPYMMVFNSDGQIIASNALLRDVAPKIPSGIFESASTTGEARVTWEPEPGIRSAIVAVAYGGANPGFVVVGKSLRESERRDDVIFSIIAMAWFASMVYMFVLPNFLRFIYNLRKTGIGSSP